MSHALDVNVNSVWVVVTVSVHTLWIEEETQRADITSSVASPCLCSGAGSSSRPCRPNPVAGPATRSGPPARRWDLAPAPSGATARPTWRPSFRRAACLRRYRCRGPSAAAQRTPSRLVPDRVPALAPADPAAARLLLPTIPTWAPLEPTVPKVCWSSFWCCWKRSAIANDESIQWIHQPPKVGSHRLGFSNGTAYFNYWNSVFPTSDILKRINPQQKGCTVEKYEQSDIRVRIFGPAHQNWTSFERVSTTSACRYLNVLNVLLRRSKGIVHFIEAGPGPDQLLSLPYQLLWSKNSSFFH